jgi:hypothetical protein
MSAHDIAPPKHQIQKASSGGSMNGSQSRFIALAAKTIVSHTLTYFVMGAFAYNVFHYADTMNRPDPGMRSTTIRSFILAQRRRSFAGCSSPRSFIHFATSISGASMVGCS